MPAATRHSKRLASKASSRASSVAADDHHPEQLAQVEQKTEVSDIKTVKSKKREQTQSQEAFDAHDAVARICQGETSLTTKLTKVRLQEIITTFADNHSAFARRLAEMQNERENLEYENQQLREQNDNYKRRNEGKRTMREQFYHEKVQKDVKENKEKAEAEAAAKAAAEAAAMPPPTTSRDQQDSTQMEIEPETSNTNIPQNPPATPAGAFDDDSEMEMETPQHGWFRRILSPLGGLFSPSTSRAKTMRSTAQQKQSQTPQQPPSQTLGELPADRKRPAPEPEVTEPAEASTTRATPSRTTSTPKPARSTKPPQFSDYHNMNPIVPATLDPIAEQPEQIEASKTATTPMRSAVRRNRTIDSVRKMRSEKALSKTQPRAWDPPVAPREPNADARLEKIYMRSQLQKRLDALANDEEVQEMTQRPVKRVKLDDLAAVPARRPGDAPGTFKFYGDLADSDDEMEVYEDEAEMKTNVFNKVQEPAHPQHVQKKETVKQPENIVKETPVMDVWAFPTVGKKVQEGSRVIDPFLGTQFSYGYGQHQRTGQLVVSW